MQKAKKVLGIVGNIILWVFLVFAILMTILVFSSQSNSDGVPNVFGKMLITVQSDSMKGEFNKGDLIFDTTLTAEQKANLKKGEIITFYTDLNGDGYEEINTHRIVDRYEEGGYVYYNTKGDNAETNAVQDKAPVIYSKIIGKYSGKHIAGMGNVMNFMQSTVGFLCVIVIPLVLFFLFTLYNFIKVIVAAKGGKGVTADVEEEIKKRAVEEYLKQQQAEAPAEEAPAKEEAPVGAEESK